MPNLTLLRGYSASGKSTYARDCAQHGGNVVVVSRDVIRPMITGLDFKTVLDRDSEELVTKIEKNLIETALRAGQDVIVDDTNLNPKFARPLLNLAVANGATWNVLDFHTEVETCITRNWKRAEGIPNSVIELQAQRYPMPWPELTPTVQSEPWELYVPDETLPAAWCFDLDGTLAELAQGYSPYNEAHYAHDTVRNHVRAMLDAAWHIGDFVVLLSGRPNTVRGRENTEAWLDENFINYDLLLMRPEGDHRSDAIVKSELFDKYLRDNYWVRGIFDDRPQVIRMWRARNIPVFDVGNGEEF